MRFVPAGAENGATDGENAGEGGLVEAQPAVGDQAAEAVPEPDDLHAVKTERGFAHPPDGGVQAGAVAAGGQDADAFGLGHCLQHIRTSKTGPMSRRTFAIIKPVNPVPNVAVHKTWGVRASSAG